MRAQLTQNLSANPVIAFIGLETQEDVGFHRILALILQFVSPQLVQQANATTFLIHIKHDTLTGLFHHRHRVVKLFPAIATAGGKHIAGQAARMHADQNRLVLVPAPLDQGQMQGPAIVFGKGMQLEVPVMRRQLDHHFFLDQAFGADPVGNQVGNRNELDAELVRKLAQFRQTGHRAIVAHHLHQGRRRIKPGHASQVHASFGMPGAPQHTQILRVQRIDMPRTAKVAGLGVRVGQSPDGSRTIGGGYPRSTAFQFVNRHGERGAQHRGVVFHLMRQFQFLAAGNGNRRAKHSPGMFQHEVDFLRGHFFGSNHQIAFVLAVFVIHHDKEFAFLEILDGFFHAV